MTKYERINRAKLTDKGKAVYDKLSKATDGFKDKEAVKKNKAVLDKFYDRVKSGLPEAIKPVKSKKSKAKPKAKAKKPAYKNVNMGNFAKETSALAKKEGISYKEAQKKMSAIYKERKAKAQKKQGSDFDKMIAGLKKKVEYRGGRGLGDVKERGKMRKLDLKKDAKIDALKFGKRTSKGTGANQYGKAKKGRIYYEYRNNRADVKNAPPSQPYPKLESGGKISEAGDVDFPEKLLGYAKGGIVVSTKNASRYDIEQLEDYLENESWEVKKEKDVGSYMPKMIISTKNVSREEIKELENYLDNESWDWKNSYAKGGMTKEIENDFNMPKFLKDQIIDKDGKRKIDDKSIEMLTDYTNNVMPQTKDIYFKDGKYTKERQKLHKEIIDEFKGNLVCIQQDEPIAILMGGSPASGKSTFLRKYAPYLLDDEILRIDADEVRSQLPEYDGWNASATHLETKDIVNTLLSDRTIGLPCEYDIIYDGTMNNTKAYLPLIKLLRKLGYKIYVVYIDNVPKPVIEKRVKERYQKSGRFVPLEVVDDFFSKGKKALNEIKKKVDGYMVIDGSDSNYRIIEEGGMKLPKSRKYSQIGTAIDKMATGGEVFSEQIARGYDVNLKSGTGTYAKGGDLSEYGYFKSKAKEESKSGYVVHLNMLLDMDGDIFFRLSDFYDANETIATYENGKTLLETNFDSKQDMLEWIDDNKDDYAKGGKIRVEIVDNLDDHEGYKEGTILEVVEIDEDDYMITKEGYMLSEAEVEFADKDSASNYYKKMDNPNKRYATGGKIDRKRLQNRLWYERDYEPTYTGKMSDKELKSLYDTEFYLNDELYGTSLSDVPFDEDNPGFTKGGMTDVDQNLPKEINRPILGYVKVRKDIKSSAYKDVAKKGDILPYTDVITDSNDYDDYYEQTGVIAWYKGSGNEYSFDEVEYLDDYAKGGKTKKNKMKKDDNWIQGVDKEMERKGTKGAFTKQAKKAGMSTVAFAKEVLRSPDKYSEKTRERAQFMKNVNPELFEYGGKISEAGDVDFPEKLLGYAKGGKTDAKVYNVEVTREKDGYAMDILPFDVKKSDAQVIAKNINAMKPKTAKAEIPITFAKGGSVDSFSHEIARGYDVNLKSGTGTYAVGGRLTEDSLNQAKGIKVKKLEYMKDQEGSYYISLYLDDDSSYLFYSNGRVMGRYIPKDYLDGGRERLLSALRVDYAKGGKVDKLIDLALKRQNILMEDEDNAEEKAEKIQQKISKEYKKLNAKDKQEFEDYYDSIGLARGGKTQGYNARLDESLAMRDGSKLTKKVNYKGRRDESKGEEKALGKRAYSSVDTMDDAMLDLENFYAKGGDLDWGDEYEIQIWETEEHREHLGPDTIFPNGTTDEEVISEARILFEDFAAVEVEKNGEVIFHISNDVPKGKRYAKGGKTQGYNARLDESLAMRRGKAKTKKQSKKDRRDESKAMEKAKGKRAYSSVKTMDKKVKYRGKK